MLINKYNYFFEIILQFQYEIVGNLAQWIEHRNPKIVGSKPTISNDFSNFNSKKLTFNYLKKNNYPFYFVV